MENQPQADELIAQKHRGSWERPGAVERYFERLEHAVRSEQKRAQESHLKRPLLCDAHQVAIADMGHFINTARTRARSGGVWAARWFQTRK